MTFRVFFLNGEEHRSCSCLNLYSSIYSIRSHLLSVSPIHRWMFSVPLARSSPCAATCRLPTSRSSRKSPLCACNFWATCPQFVAALAFEWELVPQTDRFERSVPRARGWRFWTGSRAGRLTSPGDASPAMARTRSPIRGLSLITSLRQASPDSVRMPEAPASLVVNTQQRRIRSLPLVPAAPS